MARPNTAFLDATARFKQQIIERFGIFQAQCCARSSSAPNFLVSEVKCESITVEHKAGPVSSSFKVHIISTLISELVDTRRAS
jgi:hypothetical protein